MMLVSHFKERITILEKKTNTVLDIINNIVQEINSLRMNSVQMIPTSNIPISNIPISNIFSKLSEIDVSENEESYDSDYENENENDEESSDIKANVETIKRINIDLNTKEEDVIDEIQVEHVIDEGEEEGEGEGEEDSVDGQEEEEEEEEEDSNYDIQISSIKLLDSYRKMDINALRTLVITKGLASDTKKLKKMDLIRLLDPNA